ncbi:hypothetical protein GCM10009332_20440 [Shewanella gelidii]|uniref:GGDEF domain-containing protein n=1 Tax=Shewanella gelidii TaxID=1642821 RepID=A0A917JRP5_9GAMM|nr:hypothetical protein GCM10009332_20440 [Shewanella gelidii]
MFFILFWTSKALAISQADKDASNIMDLLDALIFQDPQAASNKMATLEHLINKQSVQNKTRLRVSLMKCNVLVESGDFQAAIKIAQTGDAQAKLMKFEHARPYFLNCLAIAHASLDNYKVALPLFDSAASLAKQYQQPDALITALYQRAQIDTYSDNFTSAIEDLRVTLDIYSEVKTRNTHWSRPPLALIYAAMANLLHATGDFEQAIHYAKLSLAQKETVGMLSHTLQRNISRMYFDAGNEEAGELALQIAKSQLTEGNFTKLVLGFSYATLSSIELSRKNYQEAERLVLKSQRIFKTLNRSLEIMRTSRLLAQIKFALGEHVRAIELMSFAIQEAEMRQLHADLSYFYHLMATHYAQQQEYRLAYSFLNKQNQASTQANKQLNDARFIQYKARLNQHDLSQAQAQQSMNQRTQGHTSQLNWAYGVIFILTLMLVTIFIWYLVHRSNRNYLSDPLPLSETLPVNQKLEAIMSSAKKADSPLSLLLIDTSNIRQVDLPQMLDELKLKLREQDIVLRFTSNQVVVLLQYTANNGAIFVGEQLTTLIKRWQPQAAVNIGIASLQQFDTLASMVRRASISRLNKVKMETHNGH